MGKALMVASRPGDTLGSGSEINFFGYGADTTTELNTQASCTEDADFTNLRASIISGGSGTNTFQFRDAGANGQNVIAIVGAAAGEDTTHTDSLTAGDLFNIAYTDTGTNSGAAWAACNVTFASGHGNIHGCANFGGSIHDVASSTTFYPIGGSLANDGTATEDNVEWKVRGYSSFEALQVRVLANARTNNSDFRNRIDGANGSLLVQFTTGATGLISDTSPADSLSDGQTINTSLTLDTGVEDLNVTFICSTLKSSSSKSETFCDARSIAGGTARAASSTANYLPIGGDCLSLTALTEAQARIKPGFAAVVSNLRCYLSANTYTGNGTLKLYQNSNAVMTTTITASGGAGWYENTSDTITIDADDELSFAFDEGTTGDITIHAVGITFAPVAAPGGTILPQMMQHGLFLGMRT